MSHPLDLEAANDRCAEVMGMLGVVMNAMITAGCLFFVWCAWAMTKRDVLH